MLRAPLAVSLLSMALVLAASSADAKGPKSGGDEPSGFDRAAAASALGAIDLARCKAPNAKRGEGHVTVTFAPAGTASAATVDRGPMAGTPVAKCIQEKFAKAKVPAFRGDAVSVGKTFRFE